MQQERESAELCSNGCGFFGNSASGGMCSVCWKKTMSNRQVETQTYTSPTTTTSTNPTSTIPVVTTNASAVPTPVVEQSAAVEITATAEVQETPSVHVQSDKKRCWDCKKKVGLTGIECRCGFVYCRNHRYADQHNCQFDYKAADRAELAKRNPGGGVFTKLDKL